MTAEVTAASTNAGAQSGTSGGSVKVTVTESPGTEYIVCRLIDATNLERIGTATAKTTNAAIREVVASEPGDGSGSYIAIPVRSWKPVKVTPQTVTTLKLEEAK
jgi:hypothetical protein